MTDLLRVIRRMCTATAVALLVARCAFAQTPAPGAPDSTHAAQPAQAVQSKTVTVGAGKDGFTLTSADKAYKIRISGYVQADGRYYLDDAPAGAISSMLIRRARPIVDGTVNDRYSFRIAPDFGGGAVVLFDAYAEALLVPGVSFRAGKFKPPVGLERLQSATSLAFIERAAPASLVPNRDVGYQLGGDVVSGKVTYALGLFNGVLDGGNGDVDVDNGKDVAARVFLQPFKQTGPAPLEGLGFGGAMTNGVQTGTTAAPNLPAFRTTGQQTFFRYLAATMTSGPVKAAGRHHRETAQGYYYWGRIGILGEWVRSTQDVARDTMNARLAHTAWQVAATVLFTCEQASYGGVRPSEYFDPKNGHWGAIEVAGRYSVLTADDPSFPTFASPTASARVARAVGAGFNWYFTPAFKLQVNYERIRFEGGAAAAAGGNRPPEKALLTRLQVRY
jgi:phosphate-selective porin OprO/OprP